MVIQKFGVQPDDFKVHMIIRETIHLQKCKDNALIAQIISGDYRAPKDRQQLLKTNHQLHDLIKTNENSPGKL